LFTGFPLTIHFRGLPPTIHPWASGGHSRVSTNHSSPGFLPIIRISLPTAHSLVTANHLGAGFLLVICGIPLTTQSQVSANHSFSPTIHSQAFRRSFAVILGLPLTTLSTIAAHCWPVTGSADHSLTVVGLLLHSQLRVIAGHSFTSFCLSRSHLFLSS
jgi:hypothetical protein